MSLVAAVRRALLMRASLGVEGVATQADLDRAFERAGIVRWPDDAMPDRLYGAFCRGVVRVKTGLLPGTTLFVLAHELGHAECGHEQGAYVARLIADGPETSPSETEVQVYAYVFLLGAPGRTRRAIDAQLHAGVAADLPLGFLFACAGLFGAALGEGEDRAQIDHQVQRRHAPPARLAGHLCVHQHR